MYAGQTVEGGPSDEVIQRPRHPYTQLLISAAPDPDRLESNTLTPTRDATTFQDDIGDEDVVAPLAGARSVGVTSVNARYVGARQSRGEIPSLINPPTGCRFHPRCPHAMPVCSQRFPKRTELGGGHWTHCFLYGDGEANDASYKPIAVTPSRSSEGRGKDESGNHASPEVEIQGNAALPSDVSAEG